MAAKTRRRSSPPVRFDRPLTWPYVRDVYAFVLFTHANWWWMLPLLTWIGLWALVNNGWVAAGLTVWSIVVVLGLRMAYRRRVLFMNGMGGKSWREFVAGLNKERKNVAEIRSRWEKLARAEGWRDTDDKDKVARLDRLQNDAAGDFTAHIDVAKYGFDGELIRAKSSLIRDNIPGCKDIAIRKAGGTLDLYFYFNDHLNQILKIQDLPVTKDPGMMVFGKTQDGTPAQFAYWQHLLLIGNSGQGKSSIIWDLIADLIRQKIWFKLKIADGKGGQELAWFGEIEKNVWHGTMMVSAFTTSETDTLAMVKTAREAAEKRGQDYAARKIRKHTPTQADPLVITIIDEFLTLPTLIKDGTRSQLAQLLAAGRAIGYVVWAASQMPQKTALGDLRDLFPQRGCMRVDNPDQVDAALGYQMYAKGAKCSDLHEFNDRGIGWMAGESGNPVKFRAGYCDDKPYPHDNPGKESDVTLIAKGQLPRNMILQNPSEAKRWCVYIHRGFANVETGLRKVVYVGRTDRGRYDDRMAEHRRDEWWWMSEVDESVAEIADCATYAEMIAEEKRLIKLLKPTHNKVHNRDNPANAHRRVFPARPVATQPAEVRGPRWPRRTRVVEGAPEDVEVTLDQILEPEFVGTDYEGEREHAVWGE